MAFVYGLICTYRVFFGRIRTAAAGSSYKPEVLLHRARTLDTQGGYQNSHNAYLRCLGIIILQSLSPIPPNVPRCAVENL